ncbi:MAG: DegT/DnrJ/EryC1/StrS family aminotransferase [Agathobacter sp.]
MSDDMSLLEKLICLNTYQIQTGKGQVPAEQAKEHALDELKKFKARQLFLVPEDTRSNYWLNAVLLPNREEQQAFLQYTNDNGVMTRPIWELMNRLPMFENCETDHLTNTRMFADRMVNIPSSVRL